MGADGEIGGAWKPRRESRVELGEAAQEPVGIRSAEEEAERIIRREGAALKTLVESSADSSRAKPVRRYDSLANLSYIDGKANKEFLRGLDRAKDRCEKALACSPSSRGSISRRKIEDVHLTRISLPEATDLASSRPSPAAARNGAALRNGTEGFPFLRVGRRYEVRRSGLRRQSRTFPPPGGHRSLGSPRPRARPFASGHFSRSRRGSAPRSPAAPAVPTALFSAILPRVRAPPCAVLPKAGPPP